MNNIPLPGMVKYIEKNLDTTKPRFSVDILPVPCLFVNRCSNMVLIKTMTKFSNVIGYRQSNRIVYESCS